MVAGGKGFDSLESPDPGACCVTAKSHLHVYADLHPSRRSICICKYTSTPWQQQRYFRATPAFVLVLFLDAIVKAYKVEVICETGYEIALTAREAGTVVGGRVLFAHRRYGRVMGKDCSLLRYCVDGIFSWARAG